MAQRLREMTVEEFLEADVSGEIGVKIKNVDEARARVLEEASEKSLGELKSFALDLLGPIGSIAKVEAGEIEATLMAPGFPAIGRPGLGPKEISAGRDDTRPIQCYKFQPWSYGRGRWTGEAWLENRSGSRQTFRYQISCTEKPGQIYKSGWWTLPSGWALITFWRVKAPKNAHLQLTTSLR